ncbi:hypothetical protein AAMO2058_000861200 [Amorphochlora amoebiformis]
MSNLWPRGLGIWLTLPVVVARGMQPFARSVSRTPSVLSAPMTATRRIASIATPPREQIHRRVVNDKLLSRAASSKTDTSGVSDRDAKFDLWGALPLQPGGERRITMQYDIIPGKMYGFEQKFGTLDVLVNIRMTIVVLSPSAGGGLLVYSPVAPTNQCIQMMRELEKKHGKVRHIILPTTAVEHKVFFGPFAKKFKSADLWVAPGQWSFPLNLPLSALGLFPRKATILPKDPKKCDAPWLQDFDYSMLKFSLGLAPFVETAFYHKPSRTLLLTDALVYAPETPPEVVLEDPSKLLFRGKDNARDPMPNTPEKIAKAWAKTVLFSLFLQPGKVSASLLKDIPTFVAWEEGWQASWERVKESLFVSPVIQILVFSQAPKTVSSWVESLCRWPFTSIVPAHFKAPVRAGPREVRQAFKVCLDGAAQRPVSNGGDVRGDQSGDIFERLGAIFSGGQSPGYKIGLPWQELEGDFELLRSFEKGLRSTGVVKGPE